MSKQTLWGQNVLGVWLHLFCLVVGYCSSSGKYFGVCKTTSLCCLAFSQLLGDCKIGLITTLWIAQLLLSPPEKQGRKIEPVFALSISCKQLHFKKTAHAIYPWLSPLLVLRTCSTWFKMEAPSPPVCSTPPPSSLYSLSLWLSSPMMGAYIGKKRRFWGGPWKVKCSQWA